MHQSKVLRVLKDNSLVILVYYLTGHLAMYFLATPPSNGSAIWPPAGISLAVVLARGYGVLPAVFIGDLIIAIEIFGFSDFSSIVLSLVIGFQAFLSAWLGAFLIKGLLGQNDALLDNRSILLFFVLGGPISQIGSAVLTISTELWLGVINYGDVLSSIFTWWLGSSIGVILFAPLILIFIAQPRSAWKPRIIPVFFPLIFLCITGVWFFNFIKTDEQTRLRQLFDQNVSIVHQQIVDEGMELIEQGRTSRIIFNALPTVSATEFRIVSQAALKEHYEISALAWISGQGLKSASAQNFLTNGYIEPYLAIEPLQKLNLACKNTWWELHQRVEKSGQAALFEPIAVELASGKQTMAALIMPVYGNGSAVDGSKGEHYKLLGHLTLLIDYEKLKIKAADFAGKLKLALTISDHEVADSAGINSLATNYGFEKKLKIAALGKVWRFTYKPTDEFINSHTTFSYWWVFIAGFCVISLFGFIMLSVTGQTLQTQKLVDEKTRQLNNEHRLLESILNNIREGIVACDKKGRLTMLNQAAQTQYGLEARNLSPRKWAEHYHLFEADGLTQLRLIHNPLYQALMGRTINAFEMVMKQEDGSLLELSVNSQPLRDEREQIIGAVASFQDITCHKNHVNELKKLSLAVQYSPSGIMMTDTSGKIEYVNDKFEIMNGYRLVDVVGKKPSVLKSGRTADEVYKDLWKTLLNGRDWQGEFLNQKKNGEYYWSKQFISPVKNEQGKVTHFVSIMEDVTEVRRKSEMMSYQASHDDLTGLLNRRECEKRLERIIKNARKNNSRHVFCFLDLDRFKIVNDTCGHIAGDDLLRGVSELLANQLRQRDTLARLGGDEFGIIMEHCLLKQVREVAEKICTEISNYNFCWQEHSFKIGVSIGLTEVNKHSIDFNSVMEQADQACYRVKKQGRGRVAIYSDNNIVPF